MGHGCEDRQQRKKNGEVENRNEIRAEMRRKKDGGN
jgi:hypothetical protein